MSEDGGGFLSRWSRLKRGAEAPAPVPEPTAVEAGAPEETGTDGKSLEERLAELPRLDELVPGQSVAAFMQPWVPTALRNAALQRMWLLDPAISGYVDPALDYAYDYNTLGAAPGFGPMEASREAVQDVAAMFDRALRRASPEEAEVDAAAGHGPGEPAAAENPAIAIASEPPRAAVFPAADHAAAHNNVSDRNDLRPIVRRHGRALPG